MFPYYIFQASTPKVRGGAAVASSYSSSPPATARPMEGSNNNNGVTHKSGATSGDSLDSTSMLSETSTNTGRTMTDEARSSSVVSPVGGAGEPENSGDADDKSTSDSAAGTSVLSEETLSAAEPVIEEVVATSADPIERATTMRKYVAFCRSLDWLIDFFIDRLFRLIDWLIDLFLL